MRQNFRRPARTTSARMAAAAASTEVPAAEGADHSPAPWTASPPTGGSFRARLLSSCAGTAALATVVAVPLALLSSGDPARADAACGATDYGGCLVVTQGVNGAAPATPGFDKSGNNGNSGGSAAPIALTPTGNGGAPFTGQGTNAAIQAVTQGGSGSAGTNASNNARGPLPNISAGSGGAAGTAGGITLAIPQNAPVQAISSNGYGGSLASSAPGIWLYSQGGGGGGGGVPTEGGLPGVSQPGAAGGDITATILSDPKQVDPTTQAVGGVVSAQSGILLQSVAGAGGSGNNHPTDYAKAGVDGATTDANNSGNGGSANGAGGHIQATVGTSVTAFSSFSDYGPSDAQTGAPPRVTGAPALPNPPSNGSGAGLWAVSAGGNGGNGGTGSNGVLGASGGNGGDASAGGQIDITVNPGASVTTENSNSGPAPAIWAQSLGGIGGGGSGSSIGSGGNAGHGGDGGTVNVTNNGALATGLDTSPGILAQSFGGVGASGGTGGGWGASGGEGATGGNGGAITVYGDGSVRTSGANSPAILAQSVGGGGGNGGDSTGWLAVGGAGAAGGNGGALNVQYGYGGSPIATSGDRSTGILAQSIGGGGGNGGDATSTAVGPLNIVVGGTAGGGGNGGPVQATTTANITTSGLHSSGVVLQSIGGGGGNGGAAYSGLNSAGVGASVSLGGAGGAGGAGGDIALVPVDGGPPAATTRGSIVTTGANSHGLVGQSIGGGGGIGGLSGAKATVHSAATEDVPVPTVSVAVAIGGTGGEGGNGGAVTLGNAGLIATAGGGSVGVAGQSVGGGGGSAGDASATAEAKGGSNSPVNISSAIALGGRGGGGGAGGAVALNNSGLVFTRGEAADALLAQSIGGGGGSGGSGDAQAKSTGDNTNIATTLALGGAGGAGGGAGAVSVTNPGALLTLGDGATGILAQSISGGGGRAGGAAGTSRGQFAASVSVGGSGGSGGNAGAVTVANSGTVVTFGADAPAIVAQSIGRGGGIGGKSASTLGGAKNTGDGGNGAAGSVSGATASINAAFAAGGEGAVNQYNSVSGLIGVANNALGNVTATATGGLRDDGDALEDLGGSGGASGDGSSSTSIKVHVNVGGRGGAGGNAGAVQVTNTGSIGTVGAMSDGILAQAIGGGGGRGGAAVSSTTANKVNSDDQQGAAAIALGGGGGVAGIGGSVTVGNSGSIATIGPMSSGIVAQSIAGGGGIAGTSAAKVQGNNAGDTSVLALPIAIGGDGGATGTAGAVAVNNSGAIATRSHDAIGILAQSVAGGGGIVRTRSSDASDNNGGNAVATGASYGINLAFGGNGGAGDANSTAGDVSVAHTGGITTAGNNAYGILAQSVGGGGGLAQGGMPNGGASGSDFFGAGPMTGNGGNVTVTIGSAGGSAPGSVATTGLGAVAVFAQSVGGGGGVAGDTGLTTNRQPFASGGRGTGIGGVVEVDVNPKSTLSTGAGNTPVIVAQSIGGGGGRITNSTSGAFDGSAGGAGAGPQVTVNVAGAVQAAGAASAGVFAESVGQRNSETPLGGGAVLVNVAAGGTVQGGRDFNAGDGLGAGVYVVGGSGNQTGTGSAGPNTVTNAGTITSLAGVDGTAIYSTGGWTNVANQAGGTITGSINLGNGGGGGNVANLGKLNPGAIMNFGGGTLTNAGALSIGGAGRVGATAMTGTLAQTGTGRLVVDTNHSTGQADRLDVQGSVRLAGAVEVHPVAVANRPVTVLTAGQGLSLDPALASTRTQLFRFDALQAGNSLQIQPRAEFAAQAAPLGANRQAVAGHLQELWNGGAAMAAGFTALAGVADAAGYARSLDSLSGQTVGAIAASRYASSLGFAGNMLDDCPTYGQAGLSQEQAGCVWSRVFGSRTEQGSTANAAGYRVNSWTLQGGGQRQVAPGLFLGGALSYETSDFRGAAGASKVTGDALTLGATLRYQTGRWQFSGVLDAGYGWYDSKRAVEAGAFRATASASPTAWHAGAHARAAYQIPFGEQYLQPRLDLHLNYVRSGSYTETGAGPFDLSVQSEGAAAFAAVPAVEAGGRIRLSERAVLRPFASVGVSLNANSDWAATARFAGQPNSRGFRASTPVPDLLAKVTAGVELLSSANWDLRVQYTGDLGDRYASHAGSARVAYRF